MIDRRRDTFAQTLVRVLVFVVASVVGISVLYQGATFYGEASNAFHRHRQPAALPRVFVRGTLRNDGTGDFPPLCTVNHEHYGSCGKTSCWRSVEQFRASHAKIDIESSSAELPKQMELRASFQYEPWAPPSVTVDAARSRAWKSFAHEKLLGFEDSKFNSSNERIVEACLDAGTRVYLQACVSDTPGVLEACPGETRFGVTKDGDRQAVIDDAADMLARYVGGAALALFIAAIVWLKKRLPLATGLEDRAAPHRRGLGWGWALLGIPPIVGFATILMHASLPPSTWSTGRGGFTFAISMFVVWLLFALNRLIERQRTLFALAPVLETVRSPLAQASGTAELSVRARQRGEGIRAFIGDDVVAFSHLRIQEVCKSGKSTSTTEVLQKNMTDELEVVDESGDGVLHLGSSILDVELRRITLKELSPRYAERGVTVERSANHLHFIIEEHVIRDGQQLYVLGDVSKLEMKTDGVGYRNVRGTPTLGRGQGTVPVLVHAGDERGLIDALTRAARGANSYAVIAALMCTGIGVALVALAQL